MEKKIVDLIGPYKMCRKRLKDHLLLKCGLLIGPVVGCFEVIQYKDEQAMTIENLVKNTCLARYP